MELGTRNSALAVSPRRSLRDIRPYAPGKSIASTKRELGLKRVIKLASNENRLGPSPKAMAAWRRSSKLCALYPEGESPELRRALERHHGLEAGSILVGNGSDELIRLLCEAFVEPGDDVIISQYAFLRFRQQALLMGARLIEVPASGWGHDLDAMAKALGPRAKLIFIANPNNPTGTYNNAEELARLMRAVPPTALVVLDEAYCQYAQAQKDYPESLPELLRTHPNLVVLRTFSKAYGLAGLRVGYGAARPDVIAWLDRIRMPFNINLPAQEACLAALEDHGFVRKGVALVLKEREPLAEELRTLGFTVPPSSANFLFARSPIPGQELFKAVLARGVIIRPLDEYGLPQHVRITVGTAQENKVLLSAIQKVLAARTTPR